MTGRTRRGAALAAALAVAVPCAAIPGRVRGEVPGGVVRVAAAADLKFALEPILEAFRRARPESRVDVSFGSSGSFYSQIENGAPFDLFLSADAGYPRRLVEAGLSRDGRVFLYGRGRIVVWVPAASRLDPARLKERTLLDPSVRHVAIANPRHAPYGRAALAALKAWDVAAVVEPKLVLGESVSQAAQFAESGAADAGVIALSLAVAPPMRPKGRWWLVPAGAHAPIEQAGVLLKGPGDAAGAASLRDLLLGPSGRAVLAAFGFERPPG